MNNKIQSVPTVQYENCQEIQIFTLDGYHFKVNKTILADRNNYFKALFKYSDESVVFEEVSGKILYEILCYIYKKELRVDLSNIFELLIASDYLLVDDLKLELKMFLLENMSTANCVRTYLTSHLINDPDLLHISYRFIQINFQKLMEQNSLNLNHIPIECLEKFLQDSNLCITGEHIVWMCIKEYIGEDVSHRLLQLPRLLKCLKFSDVNEYLTHTILHSDVVFKYEKMVGCGGSDILNQVKMNNSEAHRNPKRLHVAVRHAKSGDAENVNVYLTFDEKIDFWAKLTETQTFPTYLTLVGHKIYIMNTCSTSNLVYNLLENQWSYMESPTRKRSSYCCVTLEKRIYILGGVEEGKYEFSGSAESYNTETGR